MFKNTVLFAFSKLEYCSGDNTTYTNEILNHFTFTYADLNINSTSTANVPRLDFTNVKVHGFFILLE